MISLHYHRILLLFFLFSLSLILLLHLTHPHSLNFNLNLNPLSHSITPFKKQKYITKGGKSITQQNVIQLRTKIKEGEYPALKKLLEDGVLGVGGGRGEKNRESASEKGAEKIIHQVWHNWEGGFGRRVERRGGGKVEGKGKGKRGEENNGIGKGKIHIAEDKEGWEVTGGDGEIPREWEERRRQCRGINGQSGWKYVLCTSEKSLSSIKTHYPSFLKTYISYPTHSQLIDAVKYLLLHKYGGIVMDLDTICLRSLDPFLMLGLFVLSEPTSASASSFSAGNYGGDGKGTGSLEMRIMGAQRNHGFVVELVDVLMGFDASGVQGERDRGVGELTLEKMGKGERVMRGRREVFGEVWDAYHKRIEEGILGVGVGVGAGAGTNSSAGMNDKREREDRGEMGLVDSVGWRVSVLRQGEGAGRGFFGPHKPNSKSRSLIKPQSQISRSSPAYLLLPLLLLISLSILIILIFFSRHRSKAGKRLSFRRSSSGYERGRRRERVLKSAGLKGGNGGYLFNGYGASGYGGEVMEEVERKGRGLMIGDEDVDEDVDGGKEGEMRGKGV
ncbi:hypothetical protein BOTCAL_0356g00120 [Botryotinia calthae]|uniref:Glycosyltransferase family 32 protein n=1 Tax=Botryotinia calthae TaxID=38488 RepID=A0A4Y8CSC9_9HELO|nr:hypothetical protein BOTCAL_0356g00120 [Botryotinia calthae]